MYISSRNADRIPQNRKGEHGVTFMENMQVSANAIADLRQSVGWNRMEGCYRSSLMTSYYHIAVYDSDALIAYIDRGSNGVTDVYIQDLRVFRGMALVRN